MTKVVFRKNTSNLSGELLQSEGTFSAKPMLNVPTDV